MRPKRALDLFSGNGSVARVLRIHGYEVVTVDHRSYLKPEKCVELVEWDFRGDLRPGDFSVVVAHPPRQLEGGGGGEDHGNCPIYSTRLLVDDRTSPK